MSTHDEQDEEAVIVDVYFMGQYMGKRRFSKDGILGRMAALDLAGAVKGIGDLQKELNEITEQSKGEQP